MNEPPSRELQVVQKHLSAKTTLLFIGESIRTNIKNAIYARVASDSYDSQKRLEEQFRTAKTYLESIGYDAAARVYTDNGYSGSSTHRPALHEFLAHASNCKFDAVVCESENRLGRGKMFEVIRDNLTCSGVEVVAADKASAFWHKMMLQDILMD